MEILIFEIHNLFSLILSNTLLYYDVNSWGTRKHWVYFFVPEYSACGTKRVKSIDTCLYIVLSVTIFMCVSLIEIIWILISISLKCFSEGSTNNNFCSGLMLLSSGNKPLYAWAWADPYIKHTSRPRDLYTVGLMPLSSYCWIHAWVQILSNTSF